MVVEGTFLSASIFDFNLKEKAVRAGFTQVSVYNPLRDAFSKLSSAVAVFSILPLCKKYKEKIHFTKFSAILFLNNNYTTNKVNMGVRKYWLMDGFCTIKWRIEAGLSGLSRGVLCVMGQSHPRP